MSDEDKTNHATNGEIIMFLRITAVVAALLALCSPAFPDSHSEAEATVMRHLAAFGALDLEALMADYDEDSVMMLPGAELRGPEQIRPAFIAFIEEFSKDGTVFELVTTAFEGPIGYITWTAETSANTYDTSTDTFYVVDGKIRTQTLTMDITPK